MPHSAIKASVQSVSLAGRDRIMDLPNRQRVYREAAPVADNSAAKPKRGSEYHDRTEVLITNSTRGTQTSAVVRVSSTR